MAKNYNPDVLNCIANLSNDEVFTPPALANQVLDMLPQELFRSPETTFLDPFTKSGVFLREIVKRLDHGLEPQIPDKRKRIDHILHRQVFGIACTELTALLSRRSVYCSKHADGKHCVSPFKTGEGNILYTPLRHTWIGGKCRYCGASQSVYDRASAAEQYAYQFIHTDNPERLFNMQFDVIIGNPPYQLSDGGNGASAQPLYHLFVNQARKLFPRYLCMIIPARWYAGGKGLDNFRKEMLNDRRIKELHDFNDASECFPGVEIKGGVCYFLWENGYNGLCTIVQHKNNAEYSTRKRALLEAGCDVFIRHNSSIDVLRKVQEYNEESFSTIVSSRKPFGFDTTFNDYSKTYFEGAVKIYARGGQGYVHKSKISANSEWINMYKLLFPEAIGSGDMTKDWIKPIVPDHNSCCTETYLVIGPFSSKEQRNNAYQYSQTKFFHFMLGLKKITQHTTSKVYQFVPLQDFSHPWTDEMLYEKYGLTEEEIAFIESMIRPME